MQTGGSTLQKDKEDTTLHPETAGQLDVLVVLMEIRVVMTQMMMIEDLGVMEAEETINVLNAKDVMVMSQAQKIMTQMRVTPTPVPTMAHDIAM